MTTSAAIDSKERQLNRRLDQELESQGTSGLTAIDTSNLTQPTFKVEEWD